MRLPVEDLQSIVSTNEGLWEALQGKKIFLTGGTGFVGAWMIESFLAANRKFSLNAEIFVLSRNPESFLNKNAHLTDEKNLKYVKGDVRSFDFPSGDFDFVIHAAAEVNSGSSAEDSFETLDIAYSGTKRVLEFCNKASVKKYLLTSSGAVYGKQPAHLEYLDEDFSGAPNLKEMSSGYGEGKRISEWLSLNFPKNSGFDVTVARCFAFFGPGIPLDGHFAAGNFIKNIVKRESIVLKSPGLSVRSYMYPTDMAAWLWNILLRGKDRSVFNVGSEESISIKELAQKLIDLDNSGLSLSISEKNQAGLAGEKYIPSTKKARSELGLKIEVNQAEAFKRTLKFYTQMERA